MKMFSKPVQSFSVLLSWKGYQFYLTFQLAIGNKAPRMKRPVIGPPEAPVKLNEAYKEISWSHNLSGFSVFTCKNGFMGIHFQS